MQKTIEDRACNITFEEKVKVYSKDYLKVCTYIQGFNKPDYIFSKKLFSTLIASSQLLEDFLDFHGAKNNKNWYFYRELAAAVRHLSLAGYSQKHISNRLAFYDLSDTEDFDKQGQLMDGFITKTLMNMAPVILDEAKRLQIALPRDAYNQADFPGITTGSSLDFDIDDEETNHHRKNIVKIASEFLSIADIFDEFRFYEPYSTKDIIEIVPEKINEVEIRQFEMLVHNLQSSFDSYVIHGGYRFGNRKLKQLRSHFSVVFHILQIMGRLLHFYERHLYDTGYKTGHKKVRNRLEELINTKFLLDRTINYGLYYTCHFLSGGKKLATEILNENIERSSIRVGIPVKLGFHARPSLLVSKIVRHYGGQVEMCVGEDRFDAGSVLDIQWAGGKIHKEHIEEVVFEGDARALHDIKILAGVNYGEDTMGKGVPLPSELGYLK
jgi:phosphotransferase system HPr-like phosphotransfer protein